MTVFFRSRFCSSTGGYNKFKPGISRSCQSLVLLALVQQAQAGVFIFTGQGTENYITHPQGYDRNVSGQITVNVCIVPGSVNATAMQIPIQNDVNTWNKLKVTTGNLISGSSNNIPSNYVDFESVALHEMGHAIGLNHPNAASESGLSGNDQNYTKATPGVNGVLDVNPGADGIIGNSDDVRGDDGNLHWFRKSNNNPFTIDTIIDSSTYSRSITDLPAGQLFATNADRTVGSSLGYSNTEAVMQQGTYFDEAQRSLEADDVATLKLGESGLDMQQGTGDDYTVNLNYLGISSTNCDINISFDNTQTSFAVTQSGGSLIAGTNHVKVTSANMYFNTGYNWFYNTLLNSIDLSISSSIDANPALTNSTINYTISVNNSSTSDAPQVKVTDTLPSKLTFIATQGCAEDPNGYPVCTLGTIAGASTGQYQITASVNADAAGTISNVATVSSVAFDDPNTSNNTSTLNTSAIADTDGDGLSDALENTTCTNPYDADTDDDGLKDGAEDVNANGVVDPGETDPCNADSDGDGIQDGTESGITTGVPDPDGTGPLLGTNLALFIPDADPSTTTDPTKFDTDGDGYSDGAEDSNKNGKVDPGESDPNNPASVPVVTQTSINVPVPGWITVLLAVIFTGIYYRLGRAVPKKNEK